jgi:predicted DCC family thiol-disulfide oxidoreductase YuxK
LVKALDRKAKLDFVGFSHPFAEELLRELTKQEFAEGMHLVEIDGTIFTGDGAMGALLRHLPGVRIIGNVAVTNGPTRRAVESLYRATAKNRAKLARFVPNVQPIQRLPKENDASGTDRHN